MLHHPAVSPDRLARQRVEKKQRPCSYCQYETPTAAQGFTHAENFWVAPSRQVAITLPAASRRQIQSAQQANQLSIAKFDAFGAGDCQNLKRATLQTLIKNAV